MAHTIGTISSLTTGTSNPMTNSVTVRDGDTVLVALIVVASATSRTGGAPTYSGKAMTQAGTTQKAASSPETSTELWYLLNPPVGTANVSVPNSGSLTVRIGCATAQSSSGASALHYQNGGHGTSTNPSITASDTDTDIWFAVIGSGATTWNPSVSPGTVINNTDHGANGAGRAYGTGTIAGSFGWTFGTIDDWAISLACFNEGKGPMRMENYKSVRGGDGMWITEGIR